MELFGTVHLSLLAAIAAGAAAIVILARRGLVRLLPLRLGLGAFLAVNELVWWAFRYSHEGLRFPHNLPLQLCDLTIWATVIACLTLARPAVELSYFAGMAGASMALLTPDLWDRFPSYPAIYFFLAHGGIVVAASALVFGGAVVLERGSVWRAFTWVAAYAAAVGAVNAMFGSNFMYLCRKPASASVLDIFGPWPLYLLGGALAALLLFWFLWLPARFSRAAPDSN